MSEFAEFTRKIVHELSTTAAPLRWFGINDPRIQEVTAGVVDNRGEDIKESWDFLDAPDFPTLSKRTVALVTGLCIGRSLQHVDGSAAGADAMGGGSVLIELGRYSNIHALTGDSLMNQGLVGSKPLNGRKWAGVALPKPGFGLTCFIREATAAPPPYCEMPWVTGFDWFVQGLSEPATEALSKLDL